jgi:hypothetical protein
MRIKVIDNKTLGGDGFELSCELSAKIVGINSTSGRTGQECFPGWPEISSFVDQRRNFTSR